MGHFLPHAAAAITASLLAVGRGELHQDLRYEACYFVPHSGGRVFETVLQRCIREGLVGGERLRAELLRILATPPDVLSPSMASVIEDLASDWRRRRAG